MANAKQCDRCGAFYSRAVTPDLTITLYRHCYGDQKIDLCDSCLKGMADFLKIDIDLSNPFGEVMEAARSSSALRKKIEVGESFDIKF